jgi:RNA polymerase sigma-70 factor (ECF subfamily)
MIAETESLLRDLWLRASSGDETALSDLCQQTRTWLANYIRRIVKDPGQAEEVLQDVYTYIWFHAEKFRDDRGTLLSWLGTLARSRAIDRLRRIRRDRVLTEFDDRVRPIISDDPSREPFEVWRHDVLRTGLRELPVDLRRLIGMAFFDGFSHSEIAERTGMPLGTVKTRIRAALIRLREKLPEEKILPRAA